MVKVFSRKLICVFRLSRLKRKFQEVGVTNQFLIMIFQIKLCNVAGLSTNLTSSPKSFDYEMKPFALCFLTHSKTCQ